MLPIRLCAWFKVYALCTLYFVLFFIFSALHPPLAGAGAVRGVSPAAGGQLQPQLPYLLPGGGRRRQETLRPGAEPRARPRAGHQGGHRTLPLPGTLDWRSH